VTAREQGREDELGDLRVADVRAPHLVEHGAERALEVTPREERGEQEVGARRAEDRDALRDPRHGAHGAPRTVALAGPSPPREQGQGRAHRRAEQRRQRPQRRGHRERLAQRAERLVEGVHGLALPGLRAPAPPPRAPHAGVAEDQGHPRRAPCGEELQEVSGEAAVARKLLHGVDEHARVTADDELSTAHLTHQHEALRGVAEVEERAEPGVGVRHGDVGDQRVDPLGQRVLRPRGGDQELSHRRVVGGALHRGRATKLQPVEQRARRAEIVEPGDAPALFDEGRHVGHPEALRGVEHQQRLAALHLVPVQHPHRPKIDVGLGRGAHQLRAAVPPAVLRVVVRDGLRGQGQQRRAQSKEHGAGASTRGHSSG
jgi:hypothetical protein